MNLFPENFDKTSGYRQSVYTPALGVILDLNSKWLLLESLGHQVS